VARIAEQLQKQAKNVVLTAITGKAAQTLQEKLPKCLSKVVTTIHKCLGLKDGRYTGSPLHRHFFSVFHAIPLRIRVQPIHHWYICHPLTLNICE
jgi:hypothetical protein